MRVMTKVRMKVRMKLVEGGGVDRMVVEMMARMDFGEVLARMGL